MKDVDLDLRSELLIVELNCSVHKVRIDLHGNCKNYLPCPQSCLK